jgi:hypothetical protein
MFLTFSGHIGQADSNTDYHEKCINIFHGNIHFTATTVSKFYFLCQSNESMYNDIFHMVIFPFQYSFST